MYELGAIADISNLLFSIVGIWMAHVLYRTPRKVWQAIAAWVIVLLVCGFGVQPLTKLLPEMSYEWASMLIGFIGIFVYMYLFPQIPVAQRIFTYFMVDTSMNLVVLFARTTSVLLAPHILLHPDIIFCFFYFPVLTGFALLFYQKLRKTIIKGLQVFQKHLTILTVFASTAYVTLLLLTDPWGRWESLGIRQALAWYGMISLIVLGYLLAFRTLVTLREQISAQQDAKYMSEQLTLSEQYYGTLVKQIEQVRIFNHDMHYHVAALSGLCAGEDMNGIKQYVADMGKSIPAALPKKYCALGGINALLEYYEKLCHERGITFYCRIQIPEEIAVRPIHLCIILGNAIQNAMEAVQAMEMPKRYLEVLASMDRGKLAIAVENPCEKKPIADEKGNLQTSKQEPGHGIGLNSIRETVRIYDGWCKTMWENGKFQLQVLLPCEADGKK